MAQDLDTPLVRPLPPVRRGTSQWLRRALIFATVVVLVNALVGDGGLAETLRARREYAAALAQLAALQRENAALAETARGLERDARTIEGVARKELGFVRRGEVMVVLGPAR